MKKITLIISLIFIANTFFAQDIIIKKDSSVIKAKITNVKKGIIKYKKANYTDGPTFQISKYKIKKIIYGNGDTANFKHFNFQISKELPDTKGLHIGTHYSPLINLIPNSVYEPAYGYNTGLDLKYYFNNKFGLKTGITYQGTENEQYFMIPENTFSANTQVSNSAIGIPLQLVYTGQKRFGLNIEVGGTYYYPFNTDFEQITINLKNNYVFTANGLFGINYRFAPRMSINAGALIQYDLINYTGQKNKPNLFTGIQFGFDYKIGK